MESHDSFAEVKAGLRDGDQGAATEVYRRFAVRLIALAHAKLDTRLRRKEDPEEVVQSVLRSFFTRTKAGKCDLANWDKLWNLLFVITKRKCLNRAKYYFTQGRDVRVEVEASLCDDSADGLSEPSDREPTGIEVLLFAETVEQVMDGLAPVDRTIIELSLEGYTPTDISAQLGCSERKVHRVRDKIKKRLERMEADETHGP